MSFISFDVNNGREIYFIQEGHDKSLRAKTYDGDDVESVLDIDPGDVIMLLNHYRNCKRYNHPIVLDSYDDSEWIGQVRWCDEDIVNALLYKLTEPTAENVGKVRSRLQHHSFTDMQIESGWEFIYSVIDDLLDEDEDQTAIGELVTYRVFFNDNDCTEVDAFSEVEAVELAKMVAAESGLGFLLDCVECMGELL